MLAQSKQPPAYLQASGAACSNNNVKRGKTKVKHKIFRKLKSLLEHDSRDPDLSR
jgi:hypothetical protein